jgi:hypothetical protein
MKAMLSFTRNVAIVGYAVMLLSKPATASAATRGCTTSPSGTCYLCGDGGCLVVCGGQFCDCCNGPCGGNDCGPAS